MTKRWLVIGLAMRAAATAASAQTVETDPLQCWWRTSAAAVRVGQPFSVVLTCAVIETDTVKIVPDQAPLDPTVMQMPPFEVLGGTHEADLRTDDRRFFQYSYRLRVVAEDAFGKDVKLPETKISYHLQSRTGDGAAIEGRELTYFLPPTSVRVLSLVPGDETDIRDASSSTFADVESRTFRADLLRTVAGVLFALSGLAVVVAVVRLFGRYRTESAANAQMVPDAAILRQVGRELSAVGHERRASGWTPALVDRLMMALRITASYALGRRAIQIPAPPHPERGTPQLPDSHAPVTGHDGYLVVRAGWLRSKRVVVAASVTPESIRHQLALASTNAPGMARRTGLLKELERALSRLTVRQYGREPQLEDQELDEAFEVGARATRQVAAHNTWLGKKLAAIDRLWAPLGQRVWSR